MRYYSGMKKSTLTAVVLLLTHFYADAHPIKMSTAKLTYDKKGGKLVLLINFFADDFGAHLQKIYRQRQVTFDASGPATDLVKDYVTKNVTVKVNNVKQVLSMESLLKTEENVVQVKFVIPATRGMHIETLEIYNELLLEAFKDQVNIMHVDLDGDGDSIVFRSFPGDTHLVVKPDFICN
jgi:hypothetical protein